MSHDVALILIAVISAVPTTLGVISTFKSRKSVEQVATDVKTLTTDVADMRDQNAADHAVVQGTIASLANQQMTMFSMLSQHISAHGDQKHPAHV